ncbi:MAG: glycosyltransferase family 4 protein [Treponema sp.]|nr:glycosyltransferase family 4 protein [Treponema sp.]
MRIGIDTCGCNHARSGVGSYLLSFVTNLPRTKEYSFELFGLEEDRFTYTSGTEIAYSAIPAQKSLKAQASWHKHRAAKFISKNQYDAVLFPSPETIPVSSGNAKSIVVVNCLYSALPEKKQKKLLKKNLKKADFVVAASEEIKKDLCNNGVSSDSIHVIHNGIDHKVFYPVLDLDSDILDIKPFAIKRPYFIYCSSLSGADKNHIELIKAFELFKKNTGLPQRLVIAGNDGAYSEPVHKAAYDSECAEDIFVTGYFPFESLAKLYAGSDACVIPAENEGVGLPLLEAMASGVPVVCAKSGALPEMGGDVPVYFDPKNIEEIASVLERVVSEEDLRSEMIKKGIERASIFNWETTVAETLSVLK